MITRGFELGSLYDKKVQLLAVLSITAPTSVIAGQVSCHKNLYLESLTYSDWCNRVLFKY